MCFRGQTTSHNLTRVTIDGLSDTSKAIDQGHGRGKTGRASEDRIPTRRTQPPVEQRSTPELTEAMRKVRSKAKAKDGTAET